MQRLRREKSCGFELNKVGLMSSGPTLLFFSTNCKIKNTDDEKQDQSRI